MYNLEKVKKCVIDARIIYDGYEYNVYDTYIDDERDEDVLMLSCYHPIGGDLSYEHRKTNLELSDDCWFEKEDFWRIKKLERILDDEE